MYSILVFGNTNWCRTGVRTLDILKLTERRHRRTHFRFHSSDTLGTYIHVLCIVVLGITLVQRPDDIIPVLNTTQPSSVFVIPEYNTLYYIQVQPPQAPHQSENHGRQKTSHDIQFIQLFQLRVKRGGG